MTRYYEYKTSTKLFNDIIETITNELNISFKLLPNSINNLYLRVQFLYYYCLPYYNNRELIIEDVEDDEENDEDDEENDEENIINNNNFYNIFITILGLNNENKKILNLIYINKNIDSLTFILPQYSQNYPQNHHKDSQNHLKDSQNDVKDSQNDVKDSQNHHKDSQNHLKDSQNDVKDSQNHPKDSQNHSQNKNNIQTCIEFLSYYTNESYNIIDKEKKRLANLDKFIIDNNINNKKKKKKKNQSLYYINHINLYKIKESILLCKKGIELREAYCSYFLHTPPSDMKIILDSEQLLNDGHYYCLNVLKRCLKLLQGWYSTYIFTKKLFEDDEKEFYSNINIQSHLSKDNNDSEYTEESDIEDIEDIDNSITTSSNNENLTDTIQSITSSPYTSNLAKKQLKIESKNFFLYFSIYWDCLLLLNYMNTLWKDIGNKKKSVFLGGLLTEISFKLLPSILSYSYVDPKLNTIDTFQYIYQIIQNDSKIHLNGNSNKIYQTGTCHLFCDDFEVENDRKQFSNLFSDSPSFDFSISESTSSSFFSTSFLTEGDVKTNINIYFMATKVVKDFCKNVLYPGTKFKKGYNISSLPFYFHSNYHSKILDISPYLDYFSNFSSYVSPDSFDFTSFSYSTISSSPYNNPPAYNYCYFILLISLHDLLKENKSYSNFYNYNSNNKIYIVKNFDSNGIEITSNNDNNNINEDAKNFDYIKNTIDFFNFSKIIKNFFIYGGKYEENIDNNIEINNNNDNIEILGFEITFLISNLICFFNNTICKDLIKNLSSLKSNDKDLFNHHFFYYKFREDINYFHDIILKNFKGFCCQSNLDYDCSKISLFINNNFDPSSNTDSSSSFLSNTYSSSSFLSLTNMFSVTHELFNALNFILNYSNNFLNNPSVLKSKVSSFFLIYLGLKQLNILKESNNYLELVLNSYFFSLFLIGFPSVGNFEHYYYNVIYNSKGEEKRTFKNDLLKREQNIKEMKQNKDSKPYLYYNDYYKNKKEVFLSSLNNTNNFLSDTLTIIQLNNLSNISSDSIFEFLNEVEQRVNWEFLSLEHKDIVDISNAFNNNNSPEKIITKFMDSEEFIILKNLENNQSHTNLNSIKSNNKSEFEDFNSFFLQFNQIYSGQDNLNSMKSEVNFISIKSFFQLNHSYFYDLISYFYYKMLDIKEILDTFNNLTYSMFLNNKLKVYGEEALSILKNMFIDKGFETSTSTMSSHNTTLIIIEGSLLQVLETSTILVLLPIFDKKQLNLDEEKFLYRVLNIFNLVFYNNNIKNHFYLFPLKSSHDFSDFQEFFLMSQIPNIQSNFPSKLPSTFFDCSLYNHSQSLTYFYNSFEKFQSQVLSDKQLLALQGLIKNKLCNELIYSFNSKPSNNTISLFDYCFFGPLNDFFFFQWLYFNTNPHYFFSLFSHKIPIESDSNNYYYYIIKIISKLNDFNIFYFILVSIINSLDYNMIINIRKLLKKNNSFNYSSNFIIFHINALLDYYEQNKVRVQMQVL